MPAAMSYSEVRQNFAAAMSRVCDEHEPIIITRRKADAVVMMSLEDYSSLVETSYLLSSRANADCLRQSIREAETGRTTVVDLDDLESL